MSRDPEQWRLLDSLVCINGCGTVAIDDVSEAADGTPRCPECGQPCRLPSEKRQTLAQELGPAWETFIPVPPVLLTYTGLKAGAKIVAQVLLDHRNLEEVYLSQGTIGRMAGMSTSAVAKALSDLESARLIARSRRSKANGARTSDLIDIAPLVPGLNRLNVESTFRRQPPTPETTFRPPPLNSDSGVTPTIESMGAPPPNPPSIKKEKDQELERSRRASSLRDDGRQEDHDEEAW